VFNANVINISVLSWRAIFLFGKTGEEENTDLPKVTNKRDQIELYWVYLTIGGNNTQNLSVHLN
jgi:hypothetical protein